VYTPPGPDPLLFASTPASSASGEIRQRYGYGRRSAGPPWKYASWPGMSPLRRERADTAQDNQTKKTPRRHGPYIQKVCYGQSDQWSGGQTLFVHTGTFSFVRCMLGNTRHPPGGRKRQARHCSFTLDKVAPGRGCSVVRRPRRLHDRLARRPGCILHRSLLVHHTQAAHGRSLTTHAVVLACSLPACMTPVALPALCIQVPWDTVGLQDLHFHSRNGSAGLAQS
jgi:hypothetical protein